MKDEVNFCPKSKLALTCETGIRRIIFRVFGSALNCKPKIRDVESTIAEIEVIRLNYIDGIEL